MKKQIIFIVRLKDEKKDFFYMDLYWGQRYNFGGGYIAVLPVGEDIVKDAQGDNRMQIDTADCDFYWVRGEIKQTEYGFTDEHDSYSGGYCVLFDHTNSDKYIIKSIREKILNELYCQDADGKVVFVSDVLEILDKTEGELKQ